MALVHTLVFDRFVAGGLGSSLMLVNGMGGTLLLLSIDALPLPLRCVVPMDISPSDVGGVWDAPREPAGVKAGAVAGDVSTGGDVVGSSISEAVS